MKSAAISLILIAALILALVPSPVHAQSPDLLGVQAFLKAQPGPLQHYRDQQQTAAAIITSNSLYYGISPRLHLALLETVSQLLSDPNPPANALLQPFGTAGPSGFAAQIEWASRELRAGLGPYSRPPTLHFPDGTTITLTLNQAPEGVAVQRFLAIKRSASEWRALVDRFGQVFATYFNNELPDLYASTTAAPAAAGFRLLQPWPMGTRVVHLAYFDHAYPTVDSGADGNDFVVNYLGRGNVQYNGHDGHDYFFPDQPIGTPILAAAAGRAYARTHRGNGVVILHDDGYETVYWHLDAFAPLFAGRIDTDESVWVEAGTVLGTSGTSGFVRGTPHLHFEVRRYGRQVDPYGWYGPGPDPCLAYAGCDTSSWLWDSSLYGTYAFTPPDAVFNGVPALDQTPPIATFVLNPPDDLLFLAHFDGHIVPEKGQGFPIADASPTFVEGRYGQALRLPDAVDLTYPISDNLHLAAGSVSLWANIPARYPSNSINRHYLFAASANASDPTRVYTGTLALRRDQLGPGETPQWTFWTTGQTGEIGRNDLSAPDTLAPGWHHFAITWDAVQGSKALYIDGVQVAVTQGVVLPSDVGPLLHLGRFTYGGSRSGIDLDDLAIFARALSPAEIAALAQRADPFEASATQLHSRTVLIDTNAIDAEGGIVAVQLGRDGVFEDPQPYYDAFRWRLPPAEGSYDLAVRYFDRAGNSTTLTRTVALDLPPRGSAELHQSSEVRATLAISATDSHQPIQMQISQRDDFADAVWQPLRSRVQWRWQAGLPRRVAVRFRDANGTVSAPLWVVAEWKLYLPVVGR